MVNPATLTNDRAIGPIAKASLAPFKRVPALAADVSGAEKAAVIMLSSPSEHEIVRVGLPTMPRARSPAIATAQNGWIIRENSQFQAHCHFTKREWALVSAA